MLKKSDECPICRELVEQVLELDIDSSTKRNDCWRVKKCYVFFEEDSNYSSSEDSGDVEYQQTPQALNPDPATANGQTPQLSQDQNPSENPHQEILAFAQMEVE